MNNSIHIGEKIKQKIKELRIRPTELSRELNTSMQNLYGIYRRKSIDTELLQRISEAVGFDFFSYYSTASNKSIDLNNIEDRKIKKTTDKIIEEMRRWTKELEDTFQEFNSRELSYLKRINELLEERNKNSNYQTTFVKNKKEPKKTHKPRGFAVMPKAEVSRIAAMGGKSSHGGGRPPKRENH